MTSLIRRSLFLVGCVLAASCTSDLPSYSVQFAGPDAVTLTPGESAPLELTLTRFSTEEAGEVRLSVYDAPEGITLEPAESVLPAGEQTVTVTPTISAAQNAPAVGRTELYLLARDAANTSLQTLFSVFVVILEPPAPQPDFGISAEPRQITIFVGQAARPRVTVTRSQGFTGPVTLTLESPTLRIAADPVTIPADQTAATMNITTTTSTTAVPVPLRIIATSEDGRRATTGFTLVLQR
jgi:hypothetical protein